MVKITQLVCMLPKVAKNVPNPKVGTNLSNVLANCGENTFINSSRISDEFACLIGEALEKLQKNREYLPDSLYKKIEEAVLNKNFSLTNILTDHYLPLNSCKTLDDVRKLLPEIKLPNMTPKSVITSKIAEHIPEKELKRLEALAANGDLKAIDDFLEGTISPQLKDSDKYPAIKKILLEIREDIVSHNFESSYSLPYKPSPVGAGKGLGMMGNLYEDNFDEVVIEILRRNYLEGEGVHRIAVTSSKGINVTHQALKKQGYVIPTFNNNLRKELASLESRASHILSANIKTKEELISDIVESAWKTGNLKQDWHKIAKKWTILKQVWLKNSGKLSTKESYFDTEKLIEAYLLNQYEAGIRTAVNVNPFQKFIDGQPMNAKKKGFLEMLYKVATPSLVNEKKHILQMDDFKKFMANYDISGMKKAIEDLEDHYQKAFLKTFWNMNDHRAIYSEALKKEFQTANLEFERIDDFYYKHLPEGLFNI